MSLKSVIKANAAVIKFLIIFFGSYLTLALLYQGYLKYFSSEIFYPDYITHQVAKQSHQLIEWMGYEAYVVKTPNNPSMLLAIRDEYVARVVEGCNSVSVIILFLSFIVAFAKGWKETLFFIFIGGLLIYILNLIRIALLTLGLYFYPQYSEFMHEILFPLFIYGVVFFLWIYWVRTYKKENVK